MKDKGRVIRNMAAVVASLGFTGRFAYSESKGAVFTMTYSVAKDYLEYGFLCNSISPGRVQTSFVDGFISKNYPGLENEMFEIIIKDTTYRKDGYPGRN